jgi:hypothetical protein
MDTAILAALIALLGVLVAQLVATYWNYKKSDQDRKQPFLNVQLNVCVKVADNVGIIVGSSDDEKRKLAIDEFWRLYWGELSLVEDRNVEEKMVNFAEVIQKLEKNDVDLLHLRKYALELSDALRALILASWNVKLPILEHRRVTLLGSRPKGPSHSDFASARNPD